MKACKLIIKLTLFAGVVSFNYPLKVYQQNSYWPLIKGQWCFAYESDKESTTIFYRTGSPRTGMNFISKDSCVFPNGRKHLTGTGPNFISYAWKTSKDTITFISKIDTLIAKLNYLTNEELRIKPIYPVIK